ncbi:MAG TPA: hypothetical protein VD997_15315 [Phycisphaerales bacterium]|nr:hypothetical protein [Phycisphaerales bacterium]
MSGRPSNTRLVIPIEKLRDYALSSEHRTGRHKARVFRSVLGLTADHAEWLRKHILTVAESHRSDFQVGVLDEHGQRFHLDIPVTTKKGTAVIKTAWIALADESDVRLTSCYVL